LFFLRGNVSGNSHNGAFFLHTQARPWFIVRQKSQLLLIDRSSSLLSDEGDGILALHPGFHEGKGYKDGRSAQAGDAVNGNAAAGRLRKPLFEQIAPIVDDLRWRRHPVVECPIHHQDSFLLQDIGIISWVTDANNDLSVGVSKCLNKLRESTICWAVDDKEPHIPKRYLRGRRSTRHFDNDDESLDEWQ